jgi:hypothetical protein
LNVTLYTSTAAAGMLESATVFATRAVKAGYVVKQKEGRCNRYRVQAHLQLPDPTGRDTSVGEVLAVLAGEDRPGIALPLPS